MIVMGVRARQLIEFYQRTSKSQQLVLLNGSTNVLQMALKWLYMFLKITKITQRLAAS